MDKHLLRAIIPVAAALILTACSDTFEAGPAPTKETEVKQKPPEPTGPVAARTAFFEMYKPARQWATDLLPLSLVSGEVDGIVNEGGKAGVWSVVFVSPSRHEARTLTYSVADQGETIRKGVSAGAPQPWTGATRKSWPFQVTEFVTNSDEAYKAAAEKAAAWLKEHPGKKCSMTLANDPRFSGPVWFIMWGNLKSGYLAFVNATTGALVTGK